MARAKRVTLSDIAATLDITKVSVSKALRDHPDISDETKQRVREKAREMGYAPNLLARSLLSNRTKTIGVVVPKIAHIFFADAIAGINEVASSNEYDILLNVSNESASLEQRHLRTLLAMQVDGLLVSVSAETKESETFLNLQRQGVPIVFFDRALQGVDASTVTINDYEATYKGVEHAIKCGFSEFAHVAGPSHVRIGQERRRGFEDALQSHGIQPERHRIVEGGFDEQHGYDGFKQILDAGQKPDVVFAVTFPVGMGIMEAMQEVDPSLLEEITIYSFGQRRLNRFFAHPHTTIHQPAREMGARALSLLLEEIDNPDAERQHVVLPTPIITPHTVSTHSGVEGRLSRSG